MTGNLRATAGLEEKRKRRENWTKKHTSQDKRTAQKKRSGEKKQEIPNTKSSKSTILNITDYINNLDTPTNSPTHRTDADLEPITEEERE